MSAQAFNSKFMLKRDHRSEIVDIMHDTELKLQQIEFLVNPLAASYLTPVGFYTLGFTRVLLPEFYVSGVAINDERFRELYPFLKSLHTFLSVSGGALQPAGEVCKVVNERFVEEGMADRYQARPIDLERHIYGQAQLLRHWLDLEGCRDEAQAIQIVWREPEIEDFPVVSTARQLLIDYVPFGTKCPTPIVGENHNVYAHPATA